ncbi:MAG: type VI secretion system baseplate subunit TssE [Pirellulales bacterium]
MPELSLKERLQPSLLDRLTDDRPDEQRESREQRVLTIRQLRASVLRDLAWLLNCERLEGIQSLDEFPQVKNSVINYGIPSLSGAILSRVEFPELERRVAQAIRFFEPRILPKTLKIKVSAASSATGGENALSIQIEGQLWAQPLPQRLFLRTEVDLDTGQVEVIDQEE